MTQFSVETILALASILGAAFGVVANLIVGYIQSRNQLKKDEAQTRIEEEKEETDRLLGISNAAKLQGETWEEIVANLRTEVNRIKSEALEREKNFLYQIKSLREQLQENQARLDEVMETATRRTKELRDKLIVVTTENNRLHTQIVNMGNDNLRLQTELHSTIESTTLEIQRLTQENEQMREAIRRTNKTVEGIQKKVTGELKMKKDG